MVAVCFYFQVHQPDRLRRYGVFDTEADYFDRNANREYMQKMARNCYLPANKVLLDLCNRFGKSFRFCVSITGTALEQFELYAPEVLESFRALAATGCVEFLCETYYHSLAFLYSPEEFHQQIRLHRHTIKRLFGQNPRTFRNTNLIYSNEVGRLLGSLKLDAVITEGWEAVLGSRNPGLVYQVHREPIRLMLRHYHLSDDIAMRFSCRSWCQWPLMADTYARWLNGINGQGSLVLLGMDYDTFGQRHSAESGIFDFLAALPGHVLALGDAIKTPAECVELFPPVADLNVPRNICWTESQRDLSPWLGNAMQANALQELYRLEEVVKMRDDARLLADWRRLTTSDHFYYMNVRHRDDSQTPALSSYESPYDAYMNYMSVLDNLAARAR